jgi:sugar-phosphatase
VSQGQRPIEAVVFDMDGALLDSEPIWRAVEREVFGSLGIEVTEDVERWTAGPGDLVLLR